MSEAREYQFCGPYQQEGVSFLLSSVIRYAGVKVTWNSWKQPTLFRKCKCFHAISFIDLSSFLLRMMTVYYTVCLWFLSYNVKWRVFISVYFKDLENDTVQDVRPFLLNDKRSIWTCFQDYILSGGDATFTPVPSTQRVYVLKFTSDNSRHFFWMQNVDSSNDEADAARINSLIGGDGDVEMSWALKLIWYDQNV
jgi:hypothetical protein